jgi:hypothetical protein
MKVAEMLSLGAVMALVLVGLWLTTQSMDMFMIVGGVLMIGSIIILGIYGAKAGKKQKELHEADGLYDENHFYRISMLIWTPFYLVGGFLCLKYCHKWYEALRNLQILFNVTMLMLPARLIHLFLKHRNKDRIRPSQPMPKLAKYVTAVMFGVFLFYVTYEIYSLATGKPGL